jgi:hypothetical protein
MDSVIRARSQPLPRSLEALTVLAVEAGAERFAAEAQSLDA